jgi:hypothetical protein
MRITGVVDTAEACITSISDTDKVCYLNWFITSREIFKEISKSKEESLL